MASASREPLPAMESLLSTVPRDDGPEAEVLLELASRGNGLAEVVQSLATGAVLRGRLSPERASQLCASTAEELRSLVRLNGGAGDHIERTVRLSVVVPAFNESDNLAPLWARLAPMLDELGPGELIIVDDGSVDGTWSAIESLVASDARVRGLRLSRNFGHQAALSAGMAYARGQAVCFMDADLQDPPELLAEFVAHWQQGCEVVYAVRRSRKESLAKRAAYAAFYRLYRRLADIEVPLDTGDFALVDRLVVDHVLSLPEHNRFLRGLRTWVGYRQVGIPYDRDARHAGKPKYTFHKLTRLALDGLLSFSAAPLRLASVLGIVMAAVAGVYVGFAVIARLFFGGVPQGWTSIVAVVLTLGGMQLIVVGVLGEYVARIYDETKARPNFLVAEMAESAGADR